MKSRKRKADLNNSEFDEFTNLVDRVLAVPREELDRREKEYRKQADQNPKRRGPKRKPKTSSADDHESDDKD